jgi:hypothetical protein
LTVRWRSDEHGHHSFACYCWRCDYGRFLVVNHRENSPSLHRRIMDLADAPALQPLIFKVKPDWRDSFPDLLKEINNHDAFTRPAQPVREQRAPAHPAPARPYSASRPIGPRPRTAAPF